MNFPEHVGVYGGGRMESGIAHAFLIAGAVVTFIETGERARQRIRGTVGKAERGKLTESVKDVLPRLTVAADPAALGACGLVVEAYHRRTEGRHPGERRSAGSRRCPGDEHELAVGRSVGVQLATARSLPGSALFQPGSRE